MALRPWARRMQVEVEQLPETLAALRASATQIATASADLVEVAASLRRITDALDTAGLIEATEAMTRSGETMRATAQSMQAVQEAVADTLGRLPGGDLLNPFRRRP